MEAANVLKDFKEHADGMRSHFSNKKKASPFCHCSTETKELVYINTYNKSSWNAFIHKSDIGLDSQVEK